MHQLQIRTIGKPTETWQTEAIQTYLERLRPYAKMSLIELSEGHAGSAKPDERKTKTKEAESLLKSIPANATVIALDEVGKNLSSPDFAKKVGEWSASGNTIVFLIGGSWGLDPSVRDRADFVLSFGKQTLPHMLARVVLLEQIYRAETISAGKTYHK